MHRIKSIKKHTKLIRMITTAEGSEKMYGRNKGEFCLCLLFETFIPRTTPEIFEGEEVLFSRVICSAKAREAGLPWWRSG